MNRQFQIKQSDLNQVANPRQYLGEIKRLAEDFGLEQGYLNDAVDRDEMPRLEHEDGQTYIFVRYAHETRTEIDTAPLLIIFGKEHVITVSPSHQPVIDAFKRGRTVSATTQRAKLVLLILSNT